MEAAVDLVGSAAAGGTGRILAGTLVLAAAVQADVDERNLIGLGLLGWHGRVRGFFFLECGEDQERCAVSGLGLRRTANSPAFHRFSTKVRIVPAGARYGDCGHG